MTLEATHFDTENHDGQISRVCVICEAVIVTYPVPSVDSSATDLARFYDNVDNQVGAHLKAHTLGDAIARIRTLRKALGEVRVR